MEPWQIWVLVALALFIGEIFTPAFVLAAIGVACLATAVGAYAGLDFSMQMLTFSVATVATFVGLRPFVLTHLRSEDGDEYRSNTDALVGKTGIVLEELDAVQHSGRVRVRGEEWKALLEEGASLESGRAVRVVRVDGATLIVESVEDHDARGE